MCKVTCFLNNVLREILFNIHPTSSCIQSEITQSVLPFNTFLYLTYTQKSFWDIYAESSPFGDSNYNPGIGLGRYITKDNKLIGAGLIQIEHESNGRDGDDSRSWNRLSGSIKYFHKSTAILWCQSMDTFR